MNNTWIWQRLAQSEAFDLEVTTLNFAHRDERFHGHFYLAQFSRKLVEMVRSNLDNLVPLLLQMFCKLYHFRLIS